MAVGWVAGAAYLAPETSTYAVQPPSIVRLDVEPEAVARMLLTLRSGLKIAVRGGDGDVRQSARLVLAGLTATQKVEAQLLQRAAGKARSKSAPAMTRTG